MWNRKPANQALIARVVKVFLSSNRHSLTTAQICGILNSYSDDAIQDALAELRDDAVIACTNGNWWMRERKTKCQTK